jgi:hypothetical protein
MVTKPRQASLSINGIALVTGWEQPGTPRDGTGMGIVCNRAHLPSEFGSTVDVDAGNCQQQDVWRVGQRPARSQAGVIRRWPFEGAACFVVQAVLEAADTVHCDNGSGSKEVFSTGKSSSRCRSSAQ